MKKLMIVIAVIFMLSGGLFAQDNKFVEELKNWDFSIGGWAYLFEAEASYYSAGAKRDLGPFFNWLDDERLYGELGYLNTHVVGDTADIGEKAFGYAGLSTNANFLAECALRGMNKLFNANFSMPEIANKVMAAVGVVGAKKLDDDFWNIRKGYDYGINISVIKFNW